MLEFGKGLRLGLEFMEDQGLGFVKGLWLGLEFEGA